MVAVEIASARSYQAVRLTLTNRFSAAVTVTAMPGTVLANEDADEQDLTLTQPLALTVPAGKSVAHTVATYCIRPNNHPPHAGVRFHPRGFDQAISLFIHDHYRPRADARFQCALWGMISAREQHGNHATDSSPPGE